MKCANLYATTDPEVVKRASGQYSCAVHAGDHWIYIRAEIIECTVSETLDHQNLRDGETFLNGIPLDAEAKA